MTSQTLKYYLGCEVYVDRALSKHKATLIRLNIKSEFAKVEWMGHNFNEFTEPEKYSESVHYENITPILKTVDQLSEEEMEELLVIGNEQVEIFLEEPIQIDTDFDFIVYTYRDYDAVNKDICYEKPGPKATYWIINNGFGAIPCKESKTGYADIFGNPCYRWGDV